MWKKKSTTIWVLSSRAAILGMSVLWVSPSFALTDPIRNTSGLVSGSSSDGVRIYEGIPYPATFLCECASA